MEKVTEYCPHCEREVEIDAELKVQVCPHCGRHIVTCSMCLAVDDNNGEKHYCSNCCLEHLANKLNDNKADEERAKIAELLDKYECIPIEDGKIEYAGPSGFGYVLGISKRKGKFYIGYDVNGFLFNDETPCLDNELTLDVAKYIEENRDTMQWVEKDKEYQVILYLSGDIVENVTATNAEDAREKVFAKLRAMSDEEFLKHITDARNVGRYAIYDNESGCLEDGGFDTTM